RQHRWRPPLQSPQTENRGASARPQIWWSQFLVLSLSHTVLLPILPACGGGQGGDTLSSAYPRDSGGRRDVWGPLSRPPARSRLSLQACRKESGGTCRTAPSRRLIGTLAGRAQAL